MKNKLGIFFLFSALFLHFNLLFGQNNNSPAPYCNGGYTSGNCNQGGPSNTPGNWVNDFINSFETIGGNGNISNLNSGCNNGPNNYVSYCNHYLSVTPGQTITCNIQSGIIYQQGFAIFIDWNQDNIFNMPNERVAATSNVPAAATWTTLTFVIPPGTPNGSYRMRVRCAYATPGTNITPCGTYGYGETEDYTIYVGPITPGNGLVTATVSSNSPLCSGQNLSLTIISTPSTGLTYTWTGPNSYSSNVQNPTIFNVGSIVSGIYTVITSGACPAVKNVTIVVAPYPNFTLTPTTPTICQGGNFFASLNFAPGTNTNSFSYIWSPHPGGGIFNPYLPSTMIIPPLITPTVAIIIYSVAVTPTLLSCPVTRTLSLTIYNPVTPSLNLPPPLCNTSNVVMLTATPGGGTWSANSAVTSIGLLSPNLASIGTNTVLYSVGIGTCIVNNSGAFSVSQFNTAALSSNISTLCVQDPTVNLMGIVQTTLTGIWSGTNVNANLFNPSNLPTGIYNLTYNTSSTPIASVCPASTVLAVSVFNPPMPIINPIASLCNNAPNVFLTATPIGGVWSLNSGVTNLGLQTPSLNAIGNNSVSYTAGQGTCVASSSATFSVSQFNTAAFTASIANLCVSNNPVNLMAIVQSSAGTWSGINVVNSTSFAPAGLPTNTYSLIYTNPSSPNPWLCPDTKTIVLHVLNPPSPNITQVGPFCSNGGTTQLSVSPNTGSWTSSQYLNQAGIFTASAAVVGNNMVQYVIGTNTCNSQQSKLISVEAFVPSSIINPIPDQCNTSSAVNLLPISANNLGVWSGAGIVGASFCPNITGAGSYTLIYSTASSPSGLCPSQSTVGVTVYSLSPPVITKTGPFCNSNPVSQLLVSPVGGIFGANSPVITPQGLFNPAAANIGNNIVNYSISAGPCIAYAQTTVVVEKFISADIEIYAGPYCKNHPAINMNSFVQNSGGAWSGPAMVGNLFYPANAAFGNNNVLIYTTHSILTPTLCPDTSAIRIQVNDFPKVSAVSNVQKGCAPMLVTFSVQTNTNGKALWNFGDGSLNEQGIFINHTFSTTGIYTITLTYWDAEGCSTNTLLNTPITVLEMPKANFSYEPQVISIANPEVQLINLSTILGDNKYQWFVQGSALNAVNPMVTFSLAGIYKVRLLATSLDGCKDEITKTIIVKNDFEVYIPNSFTPNADGKNDVFIPVFSPFGIDARFYELEVFDRWGASIFYTKDIYKGWDGSYKNNGSESVKEGVYVFKVKYKDQEGIIYNKIGNIKLIGN